PPTIVSRSARRSPRTSTISASGRVGRPRPSPDAPRPGGRWGGPPPSWHATNPGSPLAASTWIDCRRCWTPARGASSSSGLSPARRIPEPRRSSSVRHLQQRADPGAQLRRRLIWVARGAPPEDSLLDLDRARQSAPQLVVLVQRQGLLRRPQPLPAGREAGM